VGRRGQVQGRWCRPGAGEGGVAGRVGGCGGAVVGRQVVRKVVCVGVWCVWGGGGVVCGSVGGGGVCVQHGVWEGGMAVQQQNGIPTSEGRICLQREAVSGGFTFVVRCSQMTFTSSARAEAVQRRADGKLNEVGVKCANGARLRASCPFGAQACPNPASPTASAEGRFSAGARRMVPIQEVWRK